MLVCKENELLKGVCQNSDLIGVQIRIDEIEGHTCEDPMKNKEKSNEAT